MHSGGSRISKLDSSVNALSEPRSSSFAFVTYYLSKWIHDMYQSVLGTEVPQWVKEKVSVEGLGTKPCLCTHWDSFSNPPTNSLPCQYKPFVDSLHVPVDDGNASNIHGVMKLKLHDFNLLWICKFTTNPQQMRVLEFQRNYAHGRFFLRDAVP